MTIEPTIVADIMSEPAVHQAYEELRGAVTEVVRFEKSKGYRPQTFDQLIEAKMDIQSKGLDPDGKLQDLLDNKEFPASQDLRKKLETAFREHGFEVSGGMSVNLKGNEWAKSSVNTEAYDLIGKIMGKTHEKFIQEASSSSASIAIPEHTLAELRESSPKYTYHDHEHVAAPAVGNPSGVRGIV